MMTKKVNRLLGINEKVSWVCIRTTYHIAVVAEIEGNATDNAWRQALDTVRKRHPNLSVQIAGNEYSTARFEHVDFGCKIPLRIIYDCEGENWTAS